MTNNDELNEDLASADEPELEAELEAEDLAEDAADAELVPVQVVRPHRVVYDGVAFVGGETAEVPRALANWWLANHWVEPAPEPEPEPEAPKKGK